MQIVQETEPPSSQKTPVFLVGQDSHGNWVVQDQDGVRGGLFVDRNEALRFIRFETGNRSYPFTIVAGNFELDMAHSSDHSSHEQFSDPMLQRRVA